MPLQTKPEDKPAAVCFHLEALDRGLQVSCSLLAHQPPAPFSIEGGSPHFANRDAFKAKVVSVGMSPAVAEDPGRSFNATARQLRGLGFSVSVPKEEEQKAAA